MDFIPIAEETGLIIPLGWWVLETACEQLLKWSQTFPHVPPVVVNVNLSISQLQQADLLERFIQLLERYQIPQRSLKLEITETCILESFTLEAQRLKQLKNLGINLCIDEFGTGYSSLSRIHEFPIDTLKIDKSFVQRLQDNFGETVRMIVTLAHSLDMDVVAEGIEDATQLDLLRELGCECGQGYWFAPPLPADEASTWLQSGDRPLGSQTSGLL